MTPCTLMSSWRCALASSSSTKRPTGMIPALLTKTSMGPSASSTLSANASTDSRRVTSSSKATVPRPSSEAVCWAGSTSTSPMATRMPSRRNVSAIARPMPRAPPVIAATCPVRMRGCLAMRRCPPANDLTGCQSLASAGPLIVAAVALLPLLLVAVAGVGLAVTGAEVVGAVFVWLRRLLGGGRHDDRWLDVGLLLEVALVAAAVAMVLVLVLVPVVALALLALVVAVVVLGRRRGHRRGRRRGGLR